MKIKFVQQAIDKIRFGSDENLKPGLTSFQKEIIQKIYECKGKIKYVEPKNKKELKNYEQRFTIKDPLGTVIKKDGIIYRSVFEKSRDNFIELYESGILQTFAEYGLIPKFELTNFYIKDNPIIFKVETLNVVPPQYWTMGMLKDEAKFILQIIEILDVFGYKLVDGHPWNITFKDGKPIFFDFGSFYKKQFRGDISYTAFAEIYKYNIIPLIMHRLDGYWSKRTFLNIFNSVAVEPSVSFEKSREVKDALKQFRNIKNFSILKRISHKKKKIILSKDIDILFKNIKTNDSFWGEYYGDNQKAFIEERYKKVLDVIKSNANNSGSFLDVAGNAGHFSSYVKKNSNFTRFISTDYDENAIELGRKLHKDENIDFYIMDCILHYAIDKNVTEYFKSDVITALALTHHLLITQGYDIDYVLNAFKQYSNKYVFIEFCPLGMYSSECKELPEVPSWYTVDWFEEHFKKHFKLIDKKVTNTINFQGKEYNHRILFAGQI